MKKLYKIKVGIEEFQVDESDIPRIAQAMKTGDIVKLDCGLFRGTSILAVCEYKSLVAFDSLPNKTPEELKIEKIKLESRMKCDKCEHTGWREELRGNNVVRVPCECVNPKDNLLE